MTYRPSAWTAAEPQLVADECEHILKTQLLRLNDGHLPSPDEIKRFGEIEYGLGDRRTRYKWKGEVILEVSWQVQADIRSFVTFPVCQACKEREEKLQAALRELRDDG